MITLCRWFCSCFYIGKLPASGAWGSLVGAALAWFFPQQLLPILIALTVLGYAFTLVSEQAFHAKDPSLFIMDEVCGMMLSVLWLPATMPVFIAAYVLFRFLDVLKPWPISILQNMKHPFGIMHDDIAAGLAANLILQVVLKLL